MISKMKTEIPEWQPANVEGLMEICIQQKLVEKETIMKLLGIKVDSATELTRKETLPVDKDGNVSHSVYDSQDLTESTNVDIHDEVDARLNDEQILAKTTTDDWCEF